MYCVDEVFLQALAGKGKCSPESLFKQIEKPAEKPFFDIVALGDTRICKQRDALRVRREYQKHLASFDCDQRPDLVVSTGDLISKKALPALRQELLKSGSSALLSIACGDSKAVLAVPGNHDLHDLSARSRGDASENANKSMSFAEPLISLITPERPPSGSPGYPVVAMFRVVPSEEDDGIGLPPIPYAHIAVVGFDSNCADSGFYDYGRIGAEQFVAFRRLVTILRETVAASTPLYVIAVTHHSVLPAEAHALHSLSTDPRALERIAGTVRSTSMDAYETLAQCRRLRVSLLLHAHMHQREVLDISTTPLDPLQLGSELAVMATPTLKPGSPRSGLARIRLDLVQGSMQLAVHHVAAPGSPAHASRKLTSASRVNVGERRLYDAASRVIRRAAENNSRRRPSEVGEYREHVIDVWKKDGCVPLGLADGRLPKAIKCERESRYNLLLLLRKSNDGGYEILLSRHTPLKPDEVGSWDSLLMPAFTDARALLGHLYDDVARQLASGTTDAATAESARAFAVAVREILRTPDDTGPLWASELREVAEIVSEKLSPTTGQATRREYHVVILLPFVRQVGADGSGDGMTYPVVTKWLQQLPRVGRPGEATTDPRVIPLDALRRGGGGLRWEPSADVEANVDPTRAKRGQPLPPGAIWFPLPNRDERNNSPEPPAWQDCPMIAHRNLDVLDEVKKAIDQRADGSGTYLPHLVLDEFRQERGFKAEPNGLLPFDLAGRATPGASAPLPQTARLACSTIEAMKRVSYVATSDLSGKPYSEKQIRRVVLHRRTLDRGGKRGDASVIMVFDADLLPGDGAVDAATEMPNDARLGLLRPVQRYVTRAGLERARRAVEFRQSLVGDPQFDQWGFVRAQVDGFAETVSLTPPIVEQLGAADTQFDDQYGTDGLEFIVCDGNHRVVHAVWNGGQPLAAVAVLGEPLHPYYAYPFSAYEWAITAAQLLPISPPSAFLYAKYAARQQPHRDGAAPPDPQWYRRYYRDLSSGFGNLGAQGGRF